MEHGGGAVVTPSEDSEAIPAMKDRNDAALAARGDVRAYERLYRGHAARIFNLARRMASPDLAPDLTQDIFVRAWEKLGTFRGDAAFGTWLHRLAINVILTRRAAAATERGRIRYEEGLLESIPAKGSGPRADLSVDFERALERLPDGARTIFVLYDVEGFKHDEIAEMLEISVGTSKAQLHRARMLLRRHLD